jgi:hypothetical protein
VTVDGCTAYQGYLRKAPASEGDARARDFGQTVLFTGKAAVVEAERGRVYSAREEQHVLLVDERKVVGGGGGSGPVKGAGGQGGSVGAVGARPTTSLVGRPAPASVGKITHL